MRLIGWLQGPFVRWPARLLGHLRFLNAELRFHDWPYLRHTARCLEHLAGLGLPLSNRTVLEVGAGIGDHTHFFLDRGCRVTVSEARRSSLAYLRKRYPELEVLRLDLESADPLGERQFEIVYAYGVLYHVGDPAKAIGFFSRHCAGMLLLQTHVSPGDDPAINRTPENRRSPTQSYSGQGCRPTRSWLMAELKKHFEFVYLPTTQPNDEEFPTDWDNAKAKPGTARAIFVASRVAIANDCLTTELPARQERSA